MGAFYYGVKLKMHKPERVPVRMFLIPCSCGTSFAVSEDFDRKGTHIRSFIPCPTCGKRHDPRNRLLRLGYHREGYWGVDDC
jgi:hydrogenase maturation factor HypF (carbamoyltransferase family)